MPFLLKNHYKLAKQSLRRHRMRSFLTCLGIAVGIACVTLILSLIGNVTHILSREVSEVGESLVIVRPHSSFDKVDEVIGELTQSASSLSPSLTLKDVEAIRKIKNIDSVAPIALSAHTVTAYDTTLDSVPTLATTSDFKNIKNLTLSSGVFLGDNTPDNAVIIGHSLANALFGNGEPVSKTITILGERFIIVGALAPLDDPINFNNIDLDSSLIVNINQLSKLNTTINISQIDIRLKETSQKEETLASLESAITESKSGDKNFSILSGSQITSPSGSLLEIVSTVLALIAGVSLIVGGISIMNIMLVTITERTHEIGVKKAVGATNKNILSEFLLESIVISFRGGILGLILGYILIFIISLITPFEVYFSWTIIAATISTSLIVGTLFGLVPSLRAAHKDPIISLKTYY